MVPRSELPSNKSTMVDMYEMNAWQKKQPGAYLWAEKCRSILVFITSASRCLEKRVIFGENHPRMQKNRKINNICIRRTNLCDNTDCNSLGGGEILTKKNTFGLPMFFIYLSGSQLAQSRPLITIS